MTVIDYLTIAVVMVLLALTLEGTLCVLHVLHVLKSGKV